MKCIRIGCGNIARLHEIKLAPLGVETIAVVDSDPIKRRCAEERGIPAFADCEQASRLNPDFWDVCTPTRTHLAAIAAILHLSPDASILVEKPICPASQIRALRRLTACSAARITVNENYSASHVTRTVRDAVQRLGMQPSHVVCEMSKNRIADTLAGRFLDEESHVFGYEGTHMAAIMLDLGKDYDIKRVRERRYEHMRLTRADGEYALYRQGAGHVRYVARNGAEVRLHTAMHGSIGFRWPHTPARLHHIADEDRNARHRVLSVTDRRRGLTVIGHYEPVADMPRSQGMVMVLQDGAIVESIGPIEDDNLSASIGAALRYFQGVGPNPYPLDRALAAVEFIRRLNVAKGDAGNEAAMPKAATVRAGGAFLQRETA